MTYQEREAAAVAEVSKRLHPVAERDGVRVWPTATEIGPNGQRVFLVTLWTPGKPDQLINTGSGVAVQVDLSRPRGWNIEGQAEVAVSADGDVTFCRMPSWNRG